MRNERYVARYFCSLDNPDATKTWFAYDRQTGAPLCDDQGMRMFTGDEIRAFLKEAECAEQLEARSPELVV